MLYNTGTRNCMQAKAKEAVCMTQESLTRAFDTLPLTEVEPENL